MRANAGHYRAGLVVQLSSHQASFILPPYFTINISSYTVQFQFFSYMTFFRGRQDSTQHTLMHSWVQYLLFYFRFPSFLLLSAIRFMVISLLYGDLLFKVSHINASIVALDVFGCILSLYTRWSVNPCIVLNGPFFFSMQSIVLHVRSSGEGSCLSVCWVAFACQWAHVTDDHYIFTHWESVSGPGLGLGYFLLRLIFFPWLGPGAGLGLCMKSAHN